MVLDLLGPNLEELFTSCGRRFSTKTVLMIGIQLLTRIEKIHAKGLIFRDMKPENVLIGRRSYQKENVLHIIDYGLSKPYIDSETKQHIVFTDKRPITGTIRYMSEFLGWVWRLTMFFLGASMLTSVWSRAGETIWRLSATSSSTS